jgi:hypothetical protein
VYINSAVNIVNTIVNRYYAFVGQILVYYVYYIIFIKFIIVLLRHAVAQLVEALRHKPEGRWCDSRWCHWNFSLT